MDILTNHDLIGLDTCLWIYHFEDHPTYKKWTHPILQAVNTGQCSGVISELTLLEILVQPLRLGLEEVVDNYKLSIDNFPNMIVSPVTREVILKGAALRAKYGLRTPDALIIATSIVQGATLMLTNDAKWKRVSEIQVICLDDLF